jgi:hypothetical protein
MTIAMRSTESPEFHALCRRWREATREWLAARNEVARLQDATAIDLSTASAVWRRLEQAERRRAALSQQIETLLGPTVDTR